MYCSSCGTELQANLNFCKRCGIRVGGDDRSKVAENLASVLGFIGGFGMLGFVAVLYMMLRSPIISPGTIMLVSFLYLATLLSICGLILRQTAPFTIGRSLPPGGPGDPPPYLRPMTTAQLHEPSQGPISITEKTTRSLEKTPVLRK